MKFFGSSKKFNGIGKYLPTAPQFGANLTTVDSAVDHVFETQLLESRSTLAKHPLGCSPSEASVGSHEIIHFSELGQLESDQIVLDLNKTNQNVKKKRGATKKKAVISYQHVARVLIYEVYLGRGCICRRRACGRQVQSVL